MRRWSAALLGLVIVVGCGGGEERTEGAKAEGTSAGGERARAPGEIAVDERALVVPAHIEIVEIVPVPIPAPLAEIPATEAEGAPAERPQDLSRDEPSLDEPSEYEPGAGIAAGGEPPLDDTPIAESPAMEVGDSEAMAAGEVSSRLCPSEVPGLTVSSRPTERGAMLTLRTSHVSEVADLRARARELATMLDDQRSGAECEPCEVDEEGARVERGRHFLETDSAMHRVRDVRLTDIPSGVRIEFVTYEGDRELTASLRRQVTEDARALREGLCPISFQTI